MPRSPCHEVPVAGSGGAQGSPEPAENLSGILPSTVPGAHQGRVPCPRIPVQVSELSHETSPERVEMDIPDQLKEVRVLLYDDRFEPVLEKVACPAVPAIEGPSVPGKERAHRPAKGALPCPHQEVRVVWQEGPSIDGERLFLNKLCQTAQKVVSVSVVLEYPRPLDPPDNDMVQGSGSVKARTAWHRELQGGD